MAKGKDIIDRLVDVVAPKTPSITSNTVTVSNNVTVKTTTVEVPPPPKPVVIPVAPPPPLVVPPTSPAIIKPKTFGENIVDAMRKGKGPVDVGDDVVNIAYVEGTNMDGTKNDDDPDGFYDVRTVVRVNSAGNVELLGVWEATTQPGWYYRKHRLNPNGGAEITLGYQQCWIVGLHHQSYLALVQNGMCAVHRDDNEDGKRDGDKIFVGDDFGINQHHGYDFSRKTIKTASAGCLVANSIKGHLNYFMPLVMSDARYKANKHYRFGTTILAQGEVK